MPERIQQLQVAIDQRPIRERVLIFATAVLVVGMLWDFTVREPIAQRAQVALDRTASLEQQVQAMQQSANSLRNQLAQLDDDGQEQQIERARDELAAVDGRLTERTLLVISPGEMVAVLRDMLAADRRLRLLSLRNHEVEAVITEAQFGNGDAGEIPRVYRHRVDLEIRGEYFALLNYMKRLEGLDWQFQWDDLRIETETYPRARARISISTLSLAEDWIGV